MVNEVIDGSGHNDLGALRTSKGNAGLSSTPQAAGHGRLDASQAEMDTGSKMREPPVSAVVESIAADGVLRQVNGMGGRWETGRMWTGGLWWLRERAGGRHRGASYPAPAGTGRSAAAAVTAAILGTRPAGSTDAQLP